MKKKPTPTQIAMAICKHSSNAGRSWDDGANNSVEARARRLVRCGYIVKGDPSGWGHSGKAVATIYCEQKGGPVDCEVPISTYDDDWLDVSADASRELDGHFIECVNSAVHLVWKV